MRYRDKWPEYAKQCDSMVIKPERFAEFEKMAKYAIANKGIYQEAASKTVSKFPWYGIAVAHKRESDAQDKAGNPLFTSYLGNGQPLWIKTTIVPEGRGPFMDKADATDPQKCREAFVAGCLDALALDKIDEQVPPWPLEKILYFEESLNGGGYDMRGLPSPYLWGGTSIQQAGKFPRDHVFDPNMWDTQLGCAGMLWMIFHFDPTFHVARES